MKKKFLAVVMAVGLSMSLIACGGQSDQSTLEKIKEEGKFTYALSGAYPPFNSIDDSGDVVGFDVDIANALASEMGVEAEPITTQWDGIVGGLKSDRFDTVIGGLAITEDRLKEVSFTEPYYYDGAQFFAKKDLNLNSIEDLTDGKVGVVTGTTFQKELETMDNIKEAVQFESDIENFMAASDGRSDGIVTSRFVGIQAPAEYNLVAVGPLLYTEDIGIAVRQEDEDLLKELNRALKVITENGTYEEISQRWFGTNILEK
ncbi:transporter substrate-binding domain-containing protein [Clostridium vincentii]|uniref:Cystine-binding periplasmic protein n=1 Tax=Clostridium vincentii TaxID=52704 RepID=A0A2T0BIP8_9CLOT|nr:transporter substrate-binding domain-containing protein [Clostridium vincentii]PRR83713.1 Cystine-binding periplasmic protein precursor [Clostridium vincentii]